MDNMQSALLAGLPGLGLSLPNGAAETMCKFRDRQFCTLV